MTTMTAKKPAAKTAAKPAAKPASKTAPKAAAKPGTAAARAPATKAEKPEVAAEAGAGQEKATGSLKIKELLELVADATGVKRKDAREVIEAALKVMGEALSRGDQVHLPELGRLKVARRADGADGSQSLVIKMHRGAPGSAEGKGEGKGAGKKKDAAEALADADE